MKIGELKKSLSRFPTDMDDSEVIFTYLDSRGKQEYDNLAFVAYAEIDVVTTIILGSMKAAIEQMKKGTLHYSDGTKPGEAGFDINELK